MKKSIFILLLTPHLLFSCLWLEGTTIDGEYKQFEDKTISSLFLKNSQQESPKEHFKKKFHREHNQSNEYLAVQHSMYGNYEEAIKLLHTIEKETPNLYATASNLGTAYELKGDLPLAIKWISKGIERNHSSHYATEWLHLLILESKLELLSDPNLLDKGHIITLPHTFQETTIITIKSKKYSIQKIRDALFYQLRERLIFIKPKDKIVADLLYTFAKIEEQTTTIEESKTLLNMAREYGFNHQDEIDSMLRNQISSDKYFFIRIIVIGISILVLLLLLNRYIKKKIKKEVLENKPVSPLSFSLSINAHMLLFTLLALPFYGFISAFYKHEFIFYFLLLPFYLTAIHFSVQEIKKRKSLTSIKQSLLWTAGIYIGFIGLLYFKFLIEASWLYWVAHILLLLTIVLFIRWKIRFMVEEQNYEK